MKSIIKRLRKIRSSGRKTQHRHSNLRWSSKQNKSRKNIMMGGTYPPHEKIEIPSIPFPSNARSSTGWNCECDKVPDDPNALTEQLLSSSEFVLEQQSSRTKPPPKSTVGNVRRFFKRGDTNGYTGLDDIVFMEEGVELTSQPSSQIDIIDDGKLTKHDIITHVNNFRISPSLDKVVTKSNWEEQTYGPVGNIVNLTVNVPDTGKGGYPRNTTTKNVKIRLIPRPMSGGRKTTYRRKKDVSSSRRKMNSESHNKKRKVMVGGAFEEILKFLNRLDHKIKINVIKNPEQPFYDVDLVRLFSYYSDNLPESVEKTQILTEISNRIKLKKKTSPSKVFDVVDVDDHDEVDGTHPPAAAATNYRVHNAPDSYRSRSRSMRTATVKHKMSNESLEEPISKKQNVMCKCTKKK